MTQNNTSSLNILYVITHIPCLARQGAQIRVLNIGKQLQKCGNVTLVYVGPEPASEDIQATKDIFENVIVMPTIKQALPQPLARLRDNFNFHWPWHYANKVSPSDREQFLKLCQQHDLVWFHTLPAADSFGQYRFEKSVMDIDDLAHIKYSFLLKTATNLRARLGAKCLVYKWRKQEMRVLDRFPIAAVCSQIDKDRLGDSDRIHIIPNGYAPPAEKPTWKPRENMRLGFIGDITYNPNKLALKWFAEQIWPVILKKAPEAKLRIVGRTPLENNFSQYPGFEPQDFIDDTASEFATWSAMVVPLQYGGGTRLKILDAFSKMCPVISTPVGAYGLQVVANENILIEEEPFAFAKACCSLLTDSQKGRALAQSAWELFEKNYTWDIIGEEIKKVVHHTVELSR